MQSMHSPGVSPLPQVANQGITSVEVDNSSKVSESTFSVCSGDMNRIELFLGVPELSQQPFHSFQTRLHAEFKPSVNPAECFIKRFEQAHSFPSIDEGVFQQL